MSNLGLGVMISRLGGNRETVEAWQLAQGKRIKTVTLKNDALRITFEDGSGIRIFDDGQSCCESRYMVCDDDLTKFTGATLVNIDTRDAPDVVDPHGEAHEVQFLDVQTSAGLIQCATHNEHNGYYGGFSIVIRKEK